MVDKFKLPIYITEEKQKSYILIYSPYCSLTTQKSWEGDIEYLYIDGVAVESFYSLIGEKIFAINRESEGLIAEDPMDAMGKISSLLYEMLKSSVSQPEIAPQNLIDAVEYIERHLFKDIEIKSVAEKYGYTEEEFRILFRRYKTMDIDIFIRHKLEELQKYSSSSVKGNHPEWLIRSINYIDDNFCDKDCLKTARSLSYISEAAFNKGFRMYTGISPLKYINNKRLEYARSFLQGDRPITDIALSAGFYDSSAFTTAFRVKYGVTPSAYRDNLKENS